MKDLKHAINKKGNSILKQLEPIIEKNKNDISDFFSAYFAQITQISNTLNQHDQTKIKELFSVKLAQLASCNESEPTTSNITNTDTSYPPKDLIAFLLLNLIYMRSLLNYYIARELPQDEVSALSTTANKLLDNDLLAFSRIYGRERSGLILIIAHR